MSKNRQKLQTWWWCWLVLLVWLALLVVSPGRGNAGNGGYRGSPAVFLSDDFWRSMEKYANANSNSEEVYGDRQQDLLEKIDKGQRFVVKTNLTLIKQNEKIIRLLEDLQRQSR